MTDRAFDPTNARTWPLTLTLDQVAAIYNRSADGIRHSLTPKSKVVAFAPRPYRKYPLTWRKADIVRDLRANDPVLRELAS